MGVPAETPAGFGSSGIGSFGGGGSSGAPGDSLRGLISGLSSAQDVQTYTNPNGATTVPHVVRPTEKAATSKGKPCGYFKTDGCIQKDGTVWRAPTGSNYMPT